MSGKHNVSEYGGKAKCNLPSEDLLREVVYSDDDDTTTNSDSGNFSDFFFIYPFVFTLISL